MKKSWRKRTDDKKILTHFEGIFISCFSPFFFVFILFHHIITYIIIASYSCKFTSFKLLRITTKRSGYIMPEKINSNLPNRMILLNAYRNEKEKRKDNTCSSRNAYRPYKSPYTKVLQRFTQNCKFFGSLNLSYWHFSLLSENICRFLKILPKMNYGNTFLLLKR